MVTEFKLTANPPSAVEEFGCAVALSLDTAVVGARNGGFDPGAAYVYVLTGSGWTQHIRLDASDKTPLDHFGAAVAIDGDYVIVGAPDGGDESQGHAYVFHRSGSSWSEQGLLVASDSMPYGSFGRSVSISGDYIIVGAGKAAYIFHRDGSNWIEQAKLTAPPSISSLSDFGRSVSINGVHAVVGDTMGGAAANEGAACVFRQTGTTWEFQAPLLTATDPVAYDRFGWSVAITGNYVIVGAPGASSGGADEAGGAYLFERSGSSWLVQSKLEPSDAHKVKRFGESVAISHNYALVGDPGDNDTAPGSGAAYLFNRTGSSWSMFGPKISASDAALFDNFGSSVALNPPHILVGAPNATDTVSHQGAAYAYPLQIDLGKTIADQYAIFASILVGLTGGGGGWIFLPGTGPVPVDPEPFRVWKSLPASKRDLIVGLALGEIASMIHDKKIQEQVEKAGADLTTKAAAALTESKRSESKERG